MDNEGLVDALNRIAENINRNTQILRELKEVLRARL
jgi:hypothetical protein